MARCPFKTKIVDASKGQSFVTKLLIIHANIEIMNTTKPTPEEFEKISDQLKKYVGRGEYKKGVDLVKKELKKFPKEFYYQYQYAKLLGDWADDLPIQSRKKLKSEAVKILKPLTKKLAGKPIQIRFGVCLNYYYQTYTFSEMYKFGKRFAKHDRKLGLYAQALGAGLTAEKKQSHRSLGSAQQWAQKSIQIWKKYNLKNEKYYFPFYSQAMSLTILGNYEKALKSLQRAAKVSQRAVNCSEFKELYSMITAANSK